MKQPSGFSFNDEASKPVHTGESFYKKRTEDNATDQTQALPDWPDPGHEIVIDDPEAIARIRGAIREEKRDGKTVLVVRDEVLEDAVDGANPDFDLDDGDAMDGVDFMLPDGVWGGTDWDDDESVAMHAMFASDSLLPDMWELVVRVDAGTGSADAHDVGSAVAARSVALAARTAAEIHAAMMLGRTDNHLRESHTKEERREWRRRVARLTGYGSWGELVSAHPDLDAFREAFASFNAAGCTEPRDVRVFNGLIVRIDPVDGEGGFSPALILPTGDDDFADPDDMEDGAD